MATLNLLCSDDRLAEMQGYAWSLSELRDLYETEREKDAQLIQRLLKTLDQCKKPDLFDNLHIHSAFEAAANQGHKLPQ